MKESDIVLTSLPQADGKMKNRPALVLRELPGYGDYLVCGVSTQVHQLIPGFDEMISQDDPDYSGSGLLAESLIRLGFIAVLPRQRIIGSIGSISGERHRRLLRNLSSYLVKDL